MICLSQSVWVHDTWKHGSRGKALKRPGLLERFRLDRLWPIEHNDIADPSNQMTIGFLRELWRKLLLLLFEAVELYLDKLVMFQRLVDGGEELRAQTLFANLEGGLELLGLRFEISDLRICKRKHALRLRDPARKREQVSLLLESANGIE